MSAPFTVAAAQQLLADWPEVDGLADLVSAFIEARAAGEWRPIESAPRDGTCVLVYREGAIYVAAWRMGYETWGVSVERFPGDVAPFTDIGDVGWPGHLAARGPSHWMPLPGPLSQK